MNAPTKKTLIIKPRAYNGNLDLNEAVKIWTSLQSSINEIYNKNQSTLSFEELYRSAYNLCLGMKSITLHNFKSLTVFS